MADFQRTHPTIDSAPDGVLLTQQDFDALVRELESLRTRHRSEVASRLRQARAFGGTTENDDLLAVLEDSAVDNARIAQLEDLVRLATVIQHHAGGGAGLGSTVLVADDAGQTTQYALIGRRTRDSERHQVTLASPVGRALWGARPGDLLRVALPSGRTRALRVLDVRHGELSEGAAPEEGVVRAA